MDELIIRWRRLAASYQGAMFPASEAYTSCANELEQAWHDHAHDGTWYPERCAICVAEMEEEGLR